MTKSIHQNSELLPDDSLPKDREGQNEWMKAKFKEWQLQWHDFFDQDELLTTTGECERPSSLPEDINADFRLIFGFHRTTPATRQKCLALFHEGAEMHRRFESFLSLSPAAMPESDAIGTFKKIAKRIQELGPVEDIDLGNFRVIDLDSNEGQNDILSTDSITVLCERSLLLATEINELSNRTADIFLTEPLYAAAGNSYHVRDWVTSAIFGGKRDQVYTMLYDLSNGGWQVRLDSDSVLLAKSAV